jgi:hypothetical protein
LAGAHIALHPPKHVQHALGICLFDQDGQSAVYRQARINEIGELTGEEQYLQSCWPLCGRGRRSGLGNGRPGLASGLRGRRRRARSPAAKRGKVHGIVAEPSDPCRCVILIATGNDAGYLLPGSV